MKFDWLQILTTLLGIWQDSMHQDHTRGSAMTVWSFFRDAIAACLSHWRWYRADRRYRLSMHMSERWLKTRIGKEEVNT